MTSFGKKIILFGGLVALFIIGISIWILAQHNAPSSFERGDIAISHEVGGTVNGHDRQDIEIIATNLSMPWDIAFLPNGEMLVTERDGLVVNISTGVTIPLENVESRGEGGLLGIVLHPDFETNRFVYLYHTVQTSSGFENHVVRYVYNDDTLQEDLIILSGIPSAIYHDGGRMEFGPDGKLWITIGDATSPEEAQNAQSRLGTLLRLNDDGSLPDDNPFPRGVYSYGHRNAQGITWDDAGNIWSTEHGRSGILSGMDELNLIVAGGNYGWPEIEGDETQDGMISPRAHSGPDETWAPASAVYWDGSIFFGGLRGQALYEAVLDGTDVVDVQRHLYREYGRLRTVRLGPDGYFYVTTSNRDGRGNPQENDDVVLKINPEIFRSR